MEPGPSLFVTETRFFENEPIFNVPILFYIENHVEIFFNIVLKMF